MTTRPARAASLSLALAVTACDRSAEDTLDAALRATAAGRAKALRPRLHPDYADALGDGDGLIRGLARWFERHPPRDWEARVDLLPSESASTRRTRATVDLRGTWGGVPTVQLDGPMEVTLERWSGYGLRSGWMTDLRDVGRFVEAWETARRAPSRETLRPLLHPSYDDDFTSQAEIRDAWIVEGPAEAVITLVRVEIREDLAHIDLHEMVRGRGTPRPVIHRLTLRTVAGRWRIASGLRFDDRPAASR